jgi:hypothetical protein
LCSLCPLWLISQTITNDSLRPSRADYRFFISSDIVVTLRSCYVVFMVGSPRRAIVVGDSLILEGVRAALENRLGLDVLVLDQPLDVSLAELGAYCPDAIIFDVSAIRPDLLLSLFQQPGPLLIGIDPETHQALVWSGRQAPAVVAADLLQAIIGGSMDGSSLSLTSTQEPAQGEERLHLLMTRQ